MRMKTCIILVTVSLLLVISSGSYAANGLVLYLSFDEDQGQVAIDGSGMGNNCDLKGNPKWIDGKYGKALEFDGKTWGEVPDSPSLDITKALTIETWAKLYGGGEGIQSAVEKGSAWVDGEYNLAPLYNGGCILQMKDLPANCADQNIGSNIQDNTWHFLAGVWDGSGIKLYIDGTLDAEMECAGTLLTNDDPLFIGARGGNQRFLVGALDEIKVYNELITDMKSPHTTAVDPQDKLAINWSSIRSEF